MGKPTAGTILKIFIYVFITFLCAYIGTQQPASSSYGHVFTSEQQNKVDYTGSTGERVLHIQVDFKHNFINSNEEEILTVLEIAPVTNLYLFKAATFAILRKNLQ
jgi:hypothetical protein